MDILPSTRYKAGATGPYIRVLDLSTNIDNFMADGWEDCHELYVSSTTEIEITGFYAVPGRISLLRLVTNVGLEDIILTANDSSSDSSNQLLGQNVVLTPDTSVLLIYDYVAQRWRAVALPNANSAGIQPNRIVSFMFENGGVVLDTNVYSQPVYIPIAAEIIGWVLLSVDSTSGTPVSGSIEFNIYKSTYAGYPTSSSIISVSADRPKITSSNKNQDLSLSNWTTTLAAGDLLLAKIESVTSITGANLMLILEPA